MEMFVHCWEYNLMNFRERWLEGNSRGRRIINHSVIKTLLPSVYLLYYRRHHDRFAKFMKKFFLKASAYWQIDVSRQFRPEQLKIPERYT